MLLLLIGAGESVTVVSGGAPPVAQGLAPAPSASVTYAIPDADASHDRPAGEASHPTPET